MISRHRPIYRVLAVYTLHNLLGVLMELNRITSVEPLYKKVFTYMRLSTHMHAGIYTLVIHKYMHIFERHMHIQMITSRNVTIIQHV